MLGHANFGKGTMFRTFFFYVGLWLTLFVSPTLAQVAPTGAERPSSATANYAAPVVIDGEKIFIIRGSSALPADQRAEKIQDRIIAIAKSSNSAIIQTEVSNHEFGKEIVVDDQFVMVISQSDADYEALEVGELASVLADAIEDSILLYRINRSSGARVDSVIAAVAWSFAFLIISVLFFAKRKVLLESLRKLVERRFRHVEKATKSILRKRAIASIIAYVAMVLLWIFYLLILYYYLSLVLLSFAESRPVANVLLNYVSEPLAGIFWGIVGHIPDMLMLAFIAFITKKIMDGVKLFFENLERGAFEIDNFEKHWVNPTHFLTRIIIIIIALVFAYPYIPGSDSQAFQGLTILAGVMLSLGSNTVVSNIMAGLFVIYRRSTNIGDRIEVGGKTGDVVEIKLMETVIKSTKNEMISIPNAQLLNSEIVNYTRRIDGRGLIVHTTVGIGYDEPPAKICAMLIEAATRTQQLRRSPEPFVLWTQLADYAINYEINAFTTRGANLPQIRSDLHKNIVQVFNENHTQIMIPSYIADPEVPKFPKEKWSGKLVHETQDPVLPVTDELKR